MSVGDNIKMLRTKYLKLTRKRFGELLGCTDKAIEAVEYGNLVNPQQKEPLYLLICKMFNVRMEWLKEGEEPVFEETIGDKVHQAAELLRLCDDEEKGLKTYLSLDDIDKQICRNFVRVLGSIFAKSATANGMDTTYQHYASTPTLSAELAADGNKIAVKKALDAFSSQQARDANRPATAPPSNDLTEDEAAELARERFRAQRRGRDASSTFEKTRDTAGSADFAADVG